MGVGEEYVRWTTFWRVWGKNMTSVDNKKETQQPPRGRGLYICAAERHGQFGM